MLRVRYSLETRSRRFVATDIVRHAANASRSNDRVRGVILGTGPDAALAGPIGLPPRGVPPLLRDGLGASHRGDVGGDPDARDDSTTPGRLATVARLVRDFRSPEPLVVALDDGVAALSARETGAADAAAALASEFTSADAAWTGDATRATARFDADAADADVIAAIREAVR